MMWADTIHRHEVHGGTSLLRLVIDGEPQLRQAVNALARAGIVTMEEVDGLTDRDLLDVPRLGPFRAHFLRFAIRTYREHPDPA